MNGKPIPRRTKRYPDAQLENCVISEPLTIAVIELVSEDNANAPFCDMVKIKFERGSNDDQQYVGLAVAFITACAHVCNMPIGEFSDLTTSVIDENLIRVRESMRQ